MKNLLLFVALFSVCAGAFGAKQKKVFIPMDYSYCGYHASEKAIPDVKAVCMVSDAASLQAAINKISSMKPDKTGFRGAVVIAEGRYLISEPLRIEASGVVIRGMGRDKTIIVREGADRGAAVYVGAVSAPKTLTAEQRAAEQKEPVATAGSRIAITWTGSEEWIRNHRCDDFGGTLSYTGWKEGDITLTWHRTVTAADGDSLTLDAPITMFGCHRRISSSDARLVVGRYQGDEVAECGIENLTIESEVNSWNPKDEDHCWEGIHIDNARDCWVRGVGFRHLASSAVNLQRGSSRITVQDCIATDPVSEVGGWRRDVFITRGEQNLFLRCISRQGIHDFAAGYCAAGPNAFVQCEGEESLGFTGSIGAWAPGLLFDIVNIDGNDISIGNLEQFRTGTGWNSANTMLWQCTAANIRCYSPDSLNRNSGHGCWGCLWGDAEWTSSNDHVAPRSLFFSQLEERLKAEGREMAVKPNLLPMSTDATTSPTVDQAMAWARESLTTPKLTIEMWIDSLCSLQGFKGEKVQKSRVPEFQNSRVPEFQKSRVPEFQSSRIPELLTSGGTYSIPWWNGRTKDSWVAKSARPAITRFVPGYVGTGWTDRISDVVAYLKDNGYSCLDHHYGLWYDIRRTDHERIRRSDGSVEPPFYEQPFSRCGQGTAWDGLSRYDLTQPNRWYFQRLNDFARQAASEGIFLLHEMYFQHNILEAGAHWVDCPWRPVNNINGTTFPEPVPFAGDKRIFMAEQFYNENDTVLRRLHKGYIRMCLDELKDNPNVVHLLSAEYTGPLHFTRFWLETIAEWEQETGRHPLIALSCTKDAQDAILQDPVLSKVVDIIDIRYWHYSDKGLWAPTEGKNMAPRQWMRKFPVGKTSHDDVEKAIEEYQNKYPDKIVIYNAQGK